MISTADTTERIMHTARNPGSICAKPKATMKASENPIDKIPNRVRLVLGLIVFEPNLFKEISNKATRQMTQNGMIVITNGMLSNTVPAKTNFGRNNTKHMTNKVRIGSQNRIKRSPGNCFRKN